MVQAIQTDQFPMVWTIGKPNKMAAILSAIALENQTPLENRTDSYHSNSKREWYLSPHCICTFPYEYPTFENWTKTIIQLPKSLVYECLVFRSSM